MNYQKIEEPCLKKLIKKSTEKESVADSRKKPTEDRT